MPFRPLQANNSDFRPIGSNSQNTSSQPQGYFGRLSQDYSNAVSGIKSGIEQGASKFASGVQQANSSGNLLDAFKGEAKATGGLLESALRTAGGVAGAAFTPITEAPIVHQVLGEAAKGIMAIPGVAHVVQNAQSLTQQHPELAKNIEAIANIAALGGGVVEKPLNKTAGTVAEKIGNKVAGNATRSIAENKDDFVRQLVREPQTMKVKQAQVDRTKEIGFGPTKRSVITPTDYEAEAEKYIKQIPGIKPGQTVQQSFNIISQYVKNEAARLKNLIKDNDFAIPRKETFARLNTAKDALKNHALLTGDARKTMNSMLVEAKRIVENNPGTGSGLLKSRKEFDSYIGNLKGKAAFDGKTMNAFTLARDAVRNTFNDLLDEKAPSLGIKKSLRKQSVLLNTMKKSLKPKAAIEADSAIGRYVQKVEQTLNLKNKAVQVAATVSGVGGLGAASQFAPFVASVGIPAFVVYKAGKFVLKPEVRRLLATALSKGGSKLTDADRNAILGILNQYGQQGNSE